MSSNDYNPLDFGEIFGIGIEKKSGGMLGLWEPKAEDFIRKRFEILRDKSNVSDYKRKLLSEDFDSRLKRHYEDQTPLADGPNPIDTGKNKVVNDGLTAINEHTTGQRSRLFSYWAIGNGTLSPTLGSTALSAEITRVNIDIDGFRNSAGTTQYWGAIFSSALIDVSISESGVLDKSTAGILYFLSVFSGSNIKNHVKDLDIPTASYVIYLTTI